MRKNRVRPNSDTGGEFIFLHARYLDDEAYRRRILTQLNRGESRQRYREGQEDQLGALGLVVNAVVLWNTSYLGRE